MVKLNIVIMSFVVLIVVSTCVPSLAGDENEAKRLWNQCIAKIRPKCALGINSQVFGNGVVSIPCCHELVQEGKKCHNRLVKYIADRPNLIGYESKYLLKRDELWAYCVSVSKTVSPA
ncbi:hypothetical protein Bca4012_057121 [Brassica carinata]